MSTGTVIIIIAVIGFGLFFMTDTGKKIFNKDYKECMKNSLYPQWCAELHL